MKKILFLITGSAIIFSACNTAEEAKKQSEEQAAAIQSQVDAKLAELSSVVDAECAATVDSLATEAYNVWVEEEAAAAKKAGKKPTVKPKPKPAPVKEEPKKDIGNKVDVGQQGGTNTNTNKVDVGQKGSESTNTKKLNVGQKGQNP